MKVPQNKKALEQYFNKEVSALEGSTIGLCAREVLLQSRSLEL